MSGIGSIISSSVSSATSVSSVRSASSAPRARAAQGSGGDSTSVSGPAAMLNKLKRLQQSDPAKFKEVMSEISTKLKDAADASGDAKDKAALSDLAQKFQVAGQTGDLAALSPPSGKGGGGGRHSRPPPPAGGVGGKPAGGVGTSASSSSSSSTEAADTNADGKVSDEERQAYAVKQEASPSSAAAYQKLAANNLKSTMNDLGSRISSVIDSALGAA